MADIEEEKVNRVSAEHKSMTGSDESYSIEESQDEIKSLNSPATQKHGERDSGQIADLQTFDEKRHVDIILTVAPKNRSLTSSAQQILQTKQDMEAKEKKAEYLRAETMRVDFDDKRRKRKSSR